ncbi:hypothetical protein [Proteus cibi]
MHSESGIREPFSSYFLSRMIYFGEHWNKSMQLISNNGFIYGIKNIEKIYYFYYLTTYGLKILIKETGEDVEINNNERPHK